MANESTNDTQCLYTTKAVQLLADGFLKITPDLVKVKQQLSELTGKQAALVDHMHKENLDISRIKHSPELHDAFNVIKCYQAKLTNIKKDMKSLHERSTKLKKRAIKLQLHVEKEAYVKSQQLKMEEDLIAKNVNQS